MHVDLPRWGTEQEAEKSVAFLGSTGSIQCPTFGLAGERQEGIERPPKRFHRIGDISSRVRRCRRNIRFDCFHHGREQRLFIFEMVVKGATTDVGFLQNDFCRRARIAMRGEQSARDRNDLCSSGRGSFDFRRHFPP